jgi:hypothetical protein
MASKTMFNFVIGFLDILSIFIFIFKKINFFFKIISDCFNVKNNFIN